MTNDGQILGLIENFIVDPNRLDRPRARHPGRGRRGPAVPERHVRPPRLAFKSMRAVKDVVVIELGKYPAPTFISVVVTVKNERRHIAQLLDSLLHQEGPFEVVIVDALSHDGTWEWLTAQATAHRISYDLPEVRLPRDRSEPGVALAKGEFVAFIDGDCFADSRWLAELRAGFRGSDVVAGTTNAVGSAAYGLLERVELFQRGSDVTYPSCNLGYRRSLFLALGGFDPRFITAEDIDLNLRAVEGGAILRPVPSAIIYPTRCAPPSVPVPVPGVLERVKAASS